MFAQINALDFLQSHFHRDGSHEQENEVCLFLFVFALYICISIHWVKLSFHEMIISRICGIKICWNWRPILYHGHTLGFKWWYLYKLNKNNWNSHFYFIILKKRYDLVGIQWYLSNDLSYRFTRNVQKLLPLSFKMAAAWTSYTVLIPLGNKYIIQTM